MKITTANNDIVLNNKGESILDSALKSSVYFEYSCKTGQCGICKTKLLEGLTCELQPQFALSDDDIKNEFILTCCCAPLSNIVIDAEDLSALHNIQVKTLPVRINEIKKYNEDIVKVKLRLPKNAKFNFVEGQYLDVILRDVRRSYSIASTSNDKEITLLIKRYENGIMSDYWFNNAKYNDLLRIEGPKGTFFIRNKKNPLLFLATGTGIAPVISILNSLDNDNEYVQSSSISVYLGNRFPDDFIWVPKFKKLNVNYVEICSRSSTSWDGEIGYVQDLAVHDLKNIKDCDVYACGSNNMINSIKQLFLELGISEKQLYSDAFLKNY